VARPVRRIPRKAFDARQVDGQWCLVHRASGRAVCWSKNNDALFKSYWAEVEASIGPVVKS
jgi:hypothetical protein